MTEVLTWLIVVLLVILLVVVAVAAVIMVVSQRKNNDRGPQGFQGEPSKNDGGAQGPQGPVGDRGFQGSSNVVVSAGVTDVTINTGEGIVFSDGSSSKIFRGSRTVVDKLLTLQFAHVAIKTSTSGRSGFDIFVTLPTGYEMVSTDTPPVSWLGFANNLGQTDTTSYPVYLFDVITTSKTTLQFRYVAVNGDTSSGPVIFFWCDFTVVVQIV